MAEIILNDGSIALVNDEDYSFINQWSWVRNRHGYAQRGYRKDGKDGKAKTAMMHRVVMGVMDDRKIDHINGDPLDNRIANLRVCTQRQNLQNRKPNRKKANGLKGVYEQSGRYKAVITLDGKSVHLGMFDTAEQAALAYNKAALQKDPIHAYLNKVQAI